MNIALNIINLEKDMILSCQKGERWAQRKLYESLYGKMMIVCMRYARDKEEAKDILNEGFVKVFKNLHKYKVGTSLNSWVRRIMVNTAIDHYRKNTRHRVDDLEYARNEATKEEDAISKCSAKEILAIVQKLPPSYRSVFSLFVVEGYSHREIANKMGITESTSRSNLVKARNKLRKLLESTEYANRG